MFDRPCLRLLAAAAGVLLAGTIQAATLTYEFDTSFGAPYDPDTAAPDGTAPWLTAVFDDGDTAGSVTLTMTFGADNGDNTVNSVYFNLDQALNASDLTYSYISGPSAGVNTTGNLSADGAGDFDIYFDFPPPPGGQVDFFNAGDTVVYTITGASLVASSFDFLSEDPSSNTGAKFAAAQIQSTGDGSQSDWIGVVPLPAAAWLFISGLGALGFLQIGGVRRERKQQEAKA